MIIARWDEVEGPVVADSLPKQNNLIEKQSDITELATQAFMSSQSIFGYDTFERTHVNMPFLQYSCKGMISFDYFEDEAVRGGRNPFFVGVFVPKKFEDSLFATFEIELQKFMLEERGKRADQIDIERLLQNLSRMQIASEAKIAFSTFQENWAMLTDDAGKIIWKFGPLDEKTSFLIASLSVQLAKIAAEEGGVMDVRFLDQRRCPEKEMEIFALVFHGRFLFIASNPDITSRLLRVSRARAEELDLVRGVLSAQAMSAYAGLWANALEPMQATIDRIFDEALKELGIDQLAQTSEIRTHAKGGTCNLAALDIAELLFLHHYLRRRFTNDLVSETEPWAIIFDASGILHAAFHKEGGVPLAGYLGAIFSFFMDLFNSHPRSIVFGVRDFTSIELLKGENYFLATQNPLSLFKEDDFYSLLKKDIPEEIFTDIKGALKRFLAEAIGNQMKHPLAENELEPLIEEYSKLSSKD
ncbi:MAG: hypothetical protein ACE5OZ_08390 [Candidatus Heimdallarchaeota archaeon]